ncbi:MAG: ABC transporter permease [Planctomycetes bacterium]|nr:ABC transporter permease [Planctomycetota bacterium]
MLDRHPFFQLFAARLRELAREPGVLFWIFGFPLMLAIGLGFAFRGEQAVIVDVAVLDGPRAAECAAALPADLGFRASVLDAEHAARALRLGKVALVVVPGDAAEASPEFRFDPARPESRLARALVHDALERAAGRVDRVTPRAAPVTEPGSRYIDFLIPGLLGMNIMSGGMWGIGYAIVDMRSKKLLKRLAATPMKRVHFLAAFLATRLVLVLVEMVLLLLFGWLVYDLEPRGSLAGIAGLCVLGACAFASLGLLTATRTAKTEVVGGLINLVMLPMFVVSGVFFSSDRFPEFVQPIVRALPLTALNDALRAAVLEGASLSEQGPRLLVLAAWGVVSFVLALRLFRWS